VIARLHLRPRCLVRCNDVSAKKLDNDRESVKAVALGEQGRAGAPRRETGLNMAHVRKAGEDGGRAAARREQRL
jgi:hypothetical protein